MTVRIKTETKLIALNRKEHADMGRYSKKLLQPQSSNQTFMTDSREMIRNEILSTLLRVELNYLN